MKIIKRSGAEVEFDPHKIVVAVSKANDSVVPSARMTPVQIKRIAEDVESAALNIKRSLSVEEIQDMVEDQIMNQRAFDVARQYITYRYVITKRSSRRIPIKTRRSTAFSATIWPARSARTSPAVFCFRRIS